MLQSQRDRLIKLRDNLRPREKQIRDNYEKSRHADVGETHKKGKKLIERSRNGEMERA